MGVRFAADVLVLGGGMAGLTAASAATRAGARVVLVERADRLGGSARLSGGFVWTAPALDDLRERDPTGDPGLAALVVDSFRDGLSYVDSLDVDMYDEVTIHGWGRGHQIDIEGYLTRCRSIVESGGNWIVLQARTERLIVDPATGRVTGARVRDREGVVEVESSTTILATGGHQGDPALGTELTSPRAPAMLVRANPTSRGDGLRLARSLGAAVGGDGGGFYGHLICRPVQRFDATEYIRCAQYHSEHALVLNLRGVRFTEESKGDHIINQDLLHQPESRGVLIADTTVWDSWGSAPAERGLEGTDRYETARAMGAHVATADTATGLADLVADWGYPASAVTAAIARHNAVEATAHRPPIVKPPFRAVEVQPSITFPFTGISVDGRMRVLDEGRVPIQGLLAAGVDIGGVYGRHYGGGLALALTTGLQAARTATSPSSVPRVTG